MKIKLLSCIFAVLLILILSAGGCDHTDFRNTGSIEVLNNPSGKFFVGEIYNFQIKVPAEFEGQLYKAMWEVEDNAPCDLIYQENAIIGEETIEFKEDRKAVFTPLRTGEFKINVFMIHTKQTSPQLLATKTISVVEKPKEILEEKENE